MIAKHEVAIAITTNHAKTQLDEHDRLSLKRLLHQMAEHKHAIFVVGPESMDYSEYERFGARQIIRMDEKYFGSIARYNRLMLSECFYRHFNTYEYILIHHLDAFLFGNDLKKWCDLGFDYVGAPWKHYRPERRNLAYIKYFLKNPRLGLKIICNLLICRKDYSGNGGLCLRRTSSFLKLLSNHRYYAENWHRNEDIFFALIAPILDEDFSVAPVDISARFAMETDPDYFYELTQGEEPFGCHGWTKHHTAFWLNKIRSALDASGATN